MAESNLFRDLSGTLSHSSGNPYSALITACSGEAVSI